MKRWLAALAVLIAAVVVVVAVPSPNSPASAHAQPVAAVRPVVVLT